MTSTLAEQLQRWQHFENILNCPEQVITHEFSSEDVIELSTQVQQAVCVWRYNMLLALSTRVRQTSKDLACCQADET